MKKLLKRIVVLLLVIVFVCFTVLTGRGYLMYRDALQQQGLSDRVAEIQSNPNYTPISDLPEMYLDAVVAVEDHRFTQHFGIDLISIGLATWNNLTSWSLQEGGSTITQQLAKNLWFTPERSILRKIKEAIMTWRLELALDKERILELYLNVAEWGNGVYGAEAAARHYFGKSAASLSRGEAARLAVMLPSPLRRTPSSAIVKRLSSRLLKRMPR